MEAVVLLLKCKLDVSFLVTHVCMLENILRFITVLILFRLFVYLLLSCTFPSMSARAAGALIRSMLSLWFECQNYCTHWSRMLIILEKCFVLIYYACDCFGFFWGGGVTSIFMIVQSFDWIKPIVEPLPRLIGYYTGKRGSKRVNGNRSEKEKHTLVGDH